MGTEKIIRQQSKKLLAGNWSSIIAVIILVCIFLITLEHSGTLVAFMLGIYNDSGEFIENAENISIYNFITAAKYFVFILISPFINGLFKMFCKVSLYGKTKVTDFFFYFKSFNLYIKTCIINILLLCIYSVPSILIDFGYENIERLFGKSLHDLSDFGIINIVLIAVTAVAIALKILFYLIFVHYQMLTYATFDNISILKCVFGMYGFMFRHLGSAIKLTFSFIGWILLCFFVLPALYVLPYIGVSAANSAKWLFFYDKDRGLLC